MTKVFDVNSGRYSHHGQTIWNTVLGKNVDLIECELKGRISLQHNAVVTMTRCHAVGRAQIMCAEGSSLLLVDCDGPIRVSSMRGSIVRAFLERGTLRFDQTCLSGMALLSGFGQLIDESGPDVTVRLLDFHDSEALRRAL